MKHARRAAAAAACSLVIGGAATPAAAHDAGGKPERLGTVVFKVSCKPDAQREINLAMAYYHSFAWAYVKEPLDRALQADAACGMAHFVRALSLLDNPFAWPTNLSPKLLDDGAAALAAARSTGLASQRERDYVEALSAFYRDHDKLNHRSRAQALEQEFDKLARRYGDDREALILHSLVLSANFDPADKSYANQLRAARQLEPLFQAMPDHPGVAHYLIHSYDYPPIAHHGLEAARRYSKIAPDAAHAQHMPSHIFTRLGAWRDSVESNRVSARSDTAKSFNSMHAFDYLVYAHLQLNQDKAAAQVMAEALALPNRADHFASAYAYSAIPARMALESGRWSEAAALELNPAAGGYPWQKYPQAEAVNAFARGVGAAMVKDGARVQAEHKRLLQLRDAAAQLKIGYWADQIEIQSEVVGGLASLVDGRVDESLRTLRQAAAREDATEKHVVTPGPIIPAREVLANALLDLDRPAEALVEYEAVLKREPNRLRATLGAARAAERQGDAAKARLHATKVLELTESADSVRPEVLHAKRLLGRA